MAELITFLDIVINYITLQLSRCAVSSVFFLLMILAIRKLFKKTTFLKGMLWSALGIILFVGKLKMYYENPVIMWLTWWWTGIFMNNFWVSRIYLMGILAEGLFIIIQRSKLNRYVKKLEKVTLFGVSIYVCDALVTPFTIGIVKPKIVLSKQMLEKYTIAELGLIIEHEKTHCRLGHLQLFALWDFLRALLWINPMLTICFPYFKQDMEEICDYIAICKSKNQSKEYGEVLMKSITLLKDPIKHAKYTVTFASEKEYEEIKTRLLKIVNFQPHKRKAIKWVVGITISILASLLLIVEVNSYRNYHISKEIEVYDMTGTKQLIKSEQLRNIVYFDEEALYIQRKEWEKLVQVQGLEDSDFLFFFGNIEKMPGYGGGGNCVVVNQTTLNEEIQVIKYNTNPSLMLWIFKMI